MSLLERYTFGCTLGKEVDRKIAGHFANPKKVRIRERTEEEGGYYFISTRRLMWKNH